jgi:CheY-like chemotaxis protein
LIKHGACHRRAQVAPDVHAFTAHGPSRGERMNIRDRRKAYELRETMMAMKPPLVLLAEDDADVRSLVATALRMDGYSVIEAHDGQDLVEHIGSALLFGHIRGELDPVALVISDIRMPGRTGIEILAGLRQSEVGVSVILMTAYADPQTLEHAERLGVDAFLRKPFEIDELRGIVRDVLTLPTHVPRSKQWARS